MTLKKKMGRRILVVGSPGAGKSTLSRKIGEVLSIKVHHIDRIFWLPNWTERSPDEFDKALLEVLSENEWVIDGNYQRTLEKRAEFADTVIFLDMNRFVCIYRVLRRVWKWRGSTRPDMGDGCEEKVEIEFLRFVWNFTKRERPGTIRLLDRIAAEKTVITLKNSKSIKKFLENLQSAYDLTLSP